jgi:lipopolysaccharide export system permease protein
MTIVDRYLLILFVKIFLVSFLSFTGLFIVVHLFSNLDELAALSKASGWPQLMWEFYGPRVAEVFDKTSAIWTLVAAVFAVSLMQRRREMTAIEAAGITKSRILRSVFLCTFVIVGLSIVNREMIIPSVKYQLVRTPQNWEQSESIPMGVYHDVETGIKIRGQFLLLLKKQIASPEIQLPIEISNDAPSRIQSLLATIEPENELHPAGLLLHQIISPDNPAELTTFLVDGKEVVLWPGDHHWLFPNQCFVVCDFDCLEAAYGKKLAAYQTLPEMMRELRQPRRWFGNAPEINIHSRILQPILDFSLLFLGLPLIITRPDKNVFLSASFCFLIVGAMQLVTIGSQSLGAYNMVRPAVLAAWLPAILFVPFAVVSLRRINT